MIVDGFGASETGAQGATLTTAGQTPAAARWAPASRWTAAHLSCVDDTPHAVASSPANATVGWLARSGRMPLGYLGDAAKTRRTYPTIDGMRSAVPGDRAQLNADGTIIVLGRDSVCINSGGEKIFAEEVEQALEAPPRGLRRRRRRHAERALGRAGDRGRGRSAPAPPPPTTSSRDTAGADLARYKLPRAFVSVDAIERAPTGKPDYAWAKTTATRALG